MKTIKQLQKEIVDLREQLTHPKLKKSEQRYLDQQIELRKQAIVYLETGPDEGYLLRAAAKLQKKIKMIRDVTPPHYGATDRRFFEKNHNVPHLQQLLNNIQIILG